MRYAAIIIILCLLEGNAYSQSITIIPDDQKQVFYGAGGTCDGYLGHWNSLNDENRALAARMVAQDIHLTHVKNYINGTPATSGGNYDNFTSFVNDIREYKPDIRVQICTQDFPDELEKTDNEGNPKKGEYDPDIPDIFQKIADYYFSVLQGFYTRGVTVNELDLLNEPGGVNNDNAIYYGRLFSESVPLLRAMIEASVQNPDGIPMPEIVGVSNWAVTGTIKWFDDWKARLPEAYDEIDIVSTHGYQNGWFEEYYQDIYDYIDGLPFMNNEQTAKLQEGDGLYEIFEQDEPDYIGDVSIALRMSDAINGGVNHFFIFNINNSSGNNAALLKTPWSGTPSGSKVYSGFRQLSSLQPAGSNVIAKELDGIGNNRVLCYRKADEDTVYVNITNITGTELQVYLDVRDLGSQTWGIKSSEIWLSDLTHELDKISDVAYPQSVDKIWYNSPVFSVSTLKLALDPSGYAASLSEQVITFDSIEDQTMDATLDLSASSNSGLDVAMELVSGPAILDGTQLKFTDFGKVTVRASQGGNEFYFPADPVERSFYVIPGFPNIAVGKPVVASSEYDDAGVYIAEKAVDGDRVSINSRWLTDKDGAYPHWIEIDFEGLYRINGMAFWTGFNGYENPVRDFRLEKWNGSSWITIFLEMGNTNPEFIKSFDEVETDKVRLYLMSGDSPIARIFEIEIYGELISSVPAHALSDPLFSIYPNPLGSGILNIDSAKQHGYIKIYDITGNLVKKMPLADQLDLSDLQSGVFFVCLDDNIVKKLIVK